MILVIDNYDSFTYNLVELLRREDEVLVLKNDELNPEETKRLIIRGVLISPGPGTPADGGISTELIRTRMGKTPILGICLGHQLLAELFGAQIIRGIRPMHGKVSEIRHDQQGIFHNIPSPTRVMRYHSLVVDSDSIPDNMEVSCTSHDGEIMGMRHKFHNLAGVQFHPESVLTTHGEAMIANWISQLPKQGQSANL